MTLDQIKNAVDNGLTVRWMNEGYKVIRDSIGQYLIWNYGGHCVGLTRRDGTLRESERDFYIDYHSQGYYDAIDEKAAQWRYGDYREGYVQGVIDSV